MTESVASRCVIMNDLNPNPPASSPEGFTIPGYDLVGEIGSGGMGRVVLGKCQRTGEQVAIKFLANSQTVAAHEAQLRFQREIRILERIRHRHVINIRGTGHHQGAPYLVMDYASGGNLRQRMESGREFSRTELQTILSEVIQALSAMEQAGVVHRDLKPENVLLDEKGEIKIADFGIASVETELGMLTRTVQVLGTYDYMSPEQRARLPVDSRADQYALAVITYELFTGKRPLGAFKPVSQVNPRFHPAVDAVLERALREDPDERFPDFAAFQTALDGAIATPRRLPRNGSARVVAAVATVIAVAVFLNVRSRRAPDVEPVTSPLSADRSLVATPPAVTPPTESSSEVPNQSAAEMAGAAVRDMPTGPGGVVLRDPLATATGPSDLPLFDPAQALKLNAEIERLLDAGVRSLESQDLRQAEDFFQEAVGKDPTDPRSHEKMALLYKHTKQFSESIAELKIALELNPKQVGARLGMASVFVTMRDYEAAIEQLDLVLEQDPNSAEALGFRGWSLYKLNRFDEARKAFDRGVELDPGDYSVRNFRSQFLLHTREFASAAANARVAIAIHANEIYPYVTLVRALISQPDPSEADLEEAVQFAKTACDKSGQRNYVTLKFYATALLRAGKFEEAVEASQRALNVARAVDKDRAGQLHTQLVEAAAKHQTTLPGSPPSQ